MSDLVIIFQSMFLGKNFDWDAVKDSVRIAKGNEDEALWFEPICKDFPANGTGGAHQVLIDGVEVPIKKIWDISGNEPQLLYSN